MVNGRNLDCFQNKQILRSWTSKVIGKNKNIFSVRDLFSTGPCLEILICFLFISMELPSAKALKHVFFLFHVNYH